METIVIEDNHTSCVVGCLRLTTPIEDAYNRLCNKIESARRVYLLWLSKNKWKTSGSLYVENQMDSESIQKINWIYSNFGKPTNGLKAISIDILRHYYGNTTITIHTVGFQNQQLNTSTTVDLAAGKYIVDNQTYNITWNMVYIGYKPPVRKQLILSDSE